MMKQKSKQVQSRNRNFAGVPIFSRSMIRWCVCYIRSLRIRITEFQDLDDLIKRHYQTWSEEHHMSRPGLEIALHHAINSKQIIETGTSAWGCDSSRLFDSFARFVNANFVSVDIRSAASEWLKFQVTKNTQFYVGDSVYFLQSVYPEHFDTTIDLAYLDSFDLDLSNPLPSELHGLEEFRSVLKYSKTGTIIVVDDTRCSVNEFPPEHRELVERYVKNTGRIPGKGSLILQRINGNRDFEVLWHSENLVVRVNSDNSLETF